MPNVLYEGARATAAIMSEGNFKISRENGIVAANQTILVNGFAARTAKANAVDVTTSFAGTGNGAMTLANPAYASNVKDGAYKVICIAAATNGGTFRVEDPEGVSLGNVNVGSAFNKAIKFTIADGATDFAVGDEFTVTVAANDDDFVWVAYNPAGTDGSEIPVGHSPYPVKTGANETVEAVFLVRDCELNKHVVAWPEGITDAQKANAIQALAEQHIILR